MSKKIDLLDIKELDINYIELDPVIESDSNTIKSNKDTDISDKEEDSIAIFSRKTHIQEVHYAT
ncbi:22147_t:CDS:2, partial [Rhizophagus irregularis]